MCAGSGIVMRAQARGQEWVRRASAEIRLHCALGRLRALDGPRHAGSRTQGAQRTQRHHHAQGVSGAVHAVSAWVGTEGLAACGGLRGLRGRRDDGGGGDMPRQQTYVPVAQPVSVPPGAFYGAQEPALQEWFMAVDTDGNGRISAQELQTALALGGLHFSLKLVSSLVRMHDVNSSNTLDFQEFSAMQAYLTRLQHTFQRVCGHSSQMSLQQVQQALAMLDIQLDMQPNGAFYKMVASYDFDRSGAIALDSFIAMNIQLRNAQKMFNLFDAQRSGRMTLDFNQLVWTIAQL